MWILLLISASIAIYFAIRIWGRDLLLRWRQKLWFRRALGSKARGVTPPLPSSNDKEQLLKENKDNEDEERLQSVIDSNKNFNYCAF